MLAGQHDFVMEQGSKFERLIQWNDANGSPHTLVGYSAAMKIRANKGDVTPIASYTSAAELVLGGVNGTIQITVTATVTAGYTFDRAFYDLEVFPTAVTASTIRILEGVITLSREVTK